MQRLPFLLVKISMLVWQYLYLSVLIPVWLPLLKYNKRPAIGAFVKNTVIHRYHPYLQKRYL